MSSCLVCSKTASMKCSNCQLNDSCYYCSRECQKSNWLVHKKVCKSDSNLKTVFLNFTKKIVGNLAIICKSNNTNYLQIDIAECYLDFVNQDFHITNLITRESHLDHPDKLRLLFTLVDYKYEMYIDKLTTSSIDVVDKECFILVE